MPSAAVDFGKAEIALPPALIAEALATLDAEPGILVPPPAGRRAAIGPLTRP
jgi:hypothetical protein